MLFEASFVLNNLAAWILKKKKQKKTNFDQYLTSVKESPKYLQAFQCYSCLKSILT